MSTGQRPGQPYPGGHQGTDVGSTAPSPVEPVEEPTRDPTEPDFGSVGSGDTTGFDFSSNEGPPEVTGGYNLPGFDPEITETSDGVYEVTGHEISPNIEEGQEAWFSTLLERMLSELAVQGEAAGYADWQISHLFETNQTQFIEYVSGLFDQADFLAQGNAGEYEYPGYEPVPNEKGVGSRLYLGSIAGFDQLVRNAWDFWRMNVDFLGKYGSVERPSTRRTGGGGRTRPTAAEIRSQFDVGALAGEVTKLWRAHLLSDPPNARAVAESYVDAIVATGAEQKIDFENFVLDVLKDTGRWAAIYINKPEGVEPLEFISPYVQAAQSVLRPREALKVAAGQAALASSPLTVSARIGRSREVRNSAPFMNNLQNTVRSVSKVLRG